MKTANPTPDQLDTQKARQCVEDLIKVTVATRKAIVAAFKVDADKRHTFSLASCEVPVQSLNELHQALLELRVVYEGYLGK